MAQQTLTQQGGMFNIYKLLWRTDAIVTLLTSAIFIFATSTVLDLIDMAEKYDWVVQGIGAVYAVYALWLLWASRDGNISRQSFQIARFLMTLFGIDMITTPLFFDVNTLGVVATVGAGAFILGLAFMWHLAARTEG